MSLFDFFFAPAKLLAARHDLALLVSAAFALAFVVVRIARRRYASLNERPMILAAAIWAVYALNEAFARDLGADLRVDLVFLWPVVLGVTALCVGVTLASVVAAFRSGRPREP